MGVRRGPKRTKGDICVGSPVSAGKGTQLVRRPWARFQRGNTPCMHAQPAQKYINVAIWMRGGRGRAGRHRGGHWGGLTLGCVGYSAVTHYPLAYSPVPLPTPSRAHAERTQTRQAGVIINSKHKGVQPPGFNSQHMHTHHERGGNLRKLGNVEARRRRQCTTGAVPHSARRPTKYL